MQYRRPLVWFCFAGFFLLALSDTARTGWESQGNAWVNGAAMVLNRSIIYTLLAIPIVAGLISEPFVRDRVCGVEPTILTTPTRPFRLGLARFAAVFFTLVTIAVSLILGMVLGTLVGGIAEEVVGPFEWEFYAKASVFILIPNLFFIASLVVAVSGRSQSRSVAFGAAIALVAFWITIRMWLGRDVFRHDWFTACSLLDPFGTIASSEFLMDQTVAQSNTNFAPIRGLLLWNRLIWITVGIGLLLFGLNSIPVRPRISRQRRLAASRSTSLFPVSLRTPLVTLVYWELRSFWRQPSTRLVLGLMGFTLWWSAGSAVTHEFSLPSTDLLIHDTNYFFGQTLILVVAWVASELVWRDRRHRVHELVDVQPTGETTRFVAKLIVLFGVVATFWTLAIAVNMVYQIAHGYFKIEPGLYLVDTFIFKAPYYLWFAVLALSLQTVVRHRYIAIVLALLVTMSEFLFDALHWYHPMFRYGRVSHFWYSLMDGYGHFGTAHRWMLLYWTLGAIIVGWFGWANFTRGVNPPSRRTLTRSRLKNVGAGRVLAFASVAFIATGVFIWYQSTLLAPWPPRNEDALNAEVERRYGESWRDKPQPRVVAIRGVLDLYPAQRRFELSGEFTLENQFDGPIETLLLLVSPGVSLDDIAIAGGATRLAIDEKLAIETWKLRRPIEPGDSATMSFRTSVSPPDGFAVHAENDRLPEVAPVEVVGNGTSLLNLRIMPAVGYTDRVEHKPAWKRRKYGLTETWKPPAAEVAAEQGHGTIHLGWVRSFEMTIRTDAGQTALHGGRLVKAWTEPDGRNAFRYRFERPARGWSNVVSARFQERTFSREGLPNVEVYFDPQHESTVDRWGEELQDALEYFTETYGEPPFETFRLAEHSLHYEGMGSRGGLASCSEILSWKSDLEASGGEDIRRRAALMMGMTWWGDQVIPANTRGAKIIHSGLPFWSASLYLSQARTPLVDRSLRLQAMQEMFRSRGGMTDQESPFVAEFKDSTQIRTKGSIQILYLAHLLGRERLEQILAAFLERWRFQGPPYPTAVMFLDHLKAETPSQYHPQIKDLFEKVTLWRCGVSAAECVESEAGGFRLTANVEARKFYTSGWGEETEAEFLTPVTIAVYSDASLSPESCLWTEDRVLASGTNLIEVELEKRPAYFAIDPNHLLIDPNPFDNFRRVGG
ncbi:MAG: hypothetical protein AAFX06_17740 [Planctomycetota bacterium]